MDPFVDRFVITGCKTRAMVGSNKKADILFAILMYCRITSLTMTKIKRHAWLQLKSTLAMIATVRS